MIRKLGAMLSLGAIVVALPVAAQAGIGVVGGFVSANISSDPQPAGTTYSSRSGFAAGLSLTAGSATGLSIAPEALYIMKGTNLSGTLGTVTYTGSAKATYLEVPLLFRLGLGQGSTHFYLTAGPQISFKLSCRTEIVTLQPEEDCNDPTDPNSGAKSTDYGVMFGAGVAMGRMTISGRYDLGLANISRDATVGAAKVKNKAILVMLGLSLGK